jgi:hypothetical protein
MLLVRFQMGSLGFFINLILASTQPIAETIHPSESSKANKSVSKETYSIVEVDKNFSVTFPIENTLREGDASSSVLFQLSFLENSIRRVQANEMDVKLNGTHQLIVYSDDVIILGGSIHTTKKNTEALVTASKQIVLEVNTENSKYIVLSRNQYAGQNGTHTER